MAHLPLDGIALEPPAAAAAAPPRPGLFRSPSRMATYRVLRVSDGVAITEEGMFTTENTPPVDETFWDEQAAAGRGIGGLTLGNCTPNEICEHLIAVLNNRINPRLFLTNGPCHYRILSVIDAETHREVRMRFSMHSYTSQEARAFRINVDIPEANRVHPFYNYRLQHVHGPRHVFYNILRNFEFRICDGGGDVLQVLARSRAPRFRAIPAQPPPVFYGPANRGDHIQHVLPLLRQCHASLYISEMFANLCESKAACITPPFNPARILHITLRDCIMPSKYAAAATRIQKWMRVLRGWRPVAHAASGGTPGAALHAFRRLYRCSFTYETGESERGVYGFSCGYHNTADWADFRHGRQLGGFLPRTPTNAMSLDRLKLLGGVGSYVCEDESIEDKEEYVKALLRPCSLNLGFAAPPVFSSYEYCKELIAAQDEKNFLPSSITAFKICGLIRTKRPKSARKTC